MSSLIRLKKVCAMWRPPFSGDTPFWDHVLNWSISCKIISVTGKCRTISVKYDSSVINISLLISSVSKRSALHIGDECVSIFGISYMFPHSSVYTDRLNDAILRFISNGLILKINNEIAWDLQRSDSGQLLQATKHKQFSFADVEERKLNLADTEGLTFVPMLWFYWNNSSALLHFSRYVLIDGNRVLGGCKCSDLGNSWRLCKTLPAVRA